jgi:hypothetical protein
VIRLKGGGRQKILENKVIREHLKMTGDITENWQVKH